ncbi:class I SAM-dependent methyltransferase [soil metagenome]
MRAEDAQLWEHANQLLERDGELELPWTHQAFDWLLRHLAQPPARMLDVGCGPAVASCLFAQMSPATQVTGVDATPPGILATGYGPSLPAGPVRPRSRTRGRPLRGAGRPGGGPGLGGTRRAPSIRPGSRSGRAWPAHVTRRPAGGDRGWTSHSGAARRLRRRTAGIHESARSRAERPLHRRLRPTRTRHVRDGGLAPADGRSGLEHLASRSFLLDLPAPVEPWVRAYLLDKFAHLWDMVGPKLDPPDAEALARLTDPTDSLGIHQRLDLFVLAAHTVHLATTH